MSCGDHANSTQLSVGQLLATGASASDIDSFGDVKEQSPCTSADSTLAMVKDAPFSATGPRPVEVRVIEEPPVADVTKLPERAEDVATWPPPPMGAAANRTTGGATFDDAPLLERGVYTAAIVPGEVLTDQVDVGWGQSVTAVADFPQPQPKLAAAIGTMDFLARIDISGPGRAPAAVGGTSGAPTSQSIVPKQAFAIGTTSTPVTYRDRGGSFPKAAASLNGHYTITVFMGNDPQNESYLLPFTLRVGVNGDAQPGPQYTQKPANSDAGTSQPTSIAPTTPAPSGQHNASGDSSDGPGAGVYVGAVGVLLLLGAGVAYLVIRRRSSNSS